MSRRYRRSKHDPGLIELAATSDWKVAAGLSFVCILSATVIIPMLFGGSRLLSGLVVLLMPVAWLMACVFAGISLVRFIKQRTASLSKPPLNPDALRREPGDWSKDGALSERDRLLLAGTLHSASPDDLPSKPTSWSKELIDSIEWKRFEDLCCEFYRAKGIRAEATALGADGGVDIRLFQDVDDPQRCTTVVQCKAWNQSVGVKPVRELRGVMAHEKVEKGFFMAPAGFSEEAKAFAAENRITLLDGKLFLAMLERLPEEQKLGLLEFATAGDWKTPTCPACGLKMTSRDGKRGRFWGCVSYPRCRGVMSMRASAR